CERLLRSAEHVNGKMACVLKHRQARRVNSEAPENEWRIQGDRCKGIAGDAIGLPIRSCGGDDRYACSVSAERGAKLAGVNRRAVACEFVGWIGNGRLLRQIIHRPAS